MFLPICLAVSPSKLLNSSLNKSTNFLIRSKVVWRRTLNSYQSHSLKRGEKDPINGIPKGMTDFRPSKPSSYPSRRWTFGQYQIGNETSLILFLMELPISCCLWSIRQMQKNIFFFRLQCLKCKLSQQGPQVSYFVSYFYIKVCNVGLSIIKG